mmetsp:Transcript_43031/g.135033  ORF Transcript_43031/g.135033 Transcript_43031/m.135033 type:complete len:265 (+) Transcript_43031:2244-3038(+)
MSPSFQAATASSSSRRRATFNFPSLANAAGAKAYAVTPPRIIGVSVRWQSSRWGGAPSRMRLGSVAPSSSLQRSRRSPGCKPSFALSTKSTSVMPLPTTLGMPLNANVAQLVLPLRLGGAPICSLSSLLFFAAWLFLIASGSRRRTKLSSEGARSRPRRRCCRCDISILDRSTGCILRTSSLLAVERLGSRGAGYVLRASMDCTLLLGEGVKVTLCNITTYKKSIHSIKQRCLLLLRSVDTSFLPGDDGGEMPRSEPSELKGLP